VAGLPFTAETQAVDTIDAVGPGFSYLQEKQTVRNSWDNWSPPLCIAMVVVGAGTGYVWGAARV
jgi:trimethylamine:corrinoid methyltransferase-like protein